MSLPGSFSSFTDQGWPPRRCTKTFVRSVTAGPRTSQCTSRSGWPLPCFYHRDAVAIHVGSPAKRNNALLATYTEEFLTMRARGIGGEPIGAAPGQGVGVLCDLKMGLPLFALY
jgi:hypothetical protein